MKKHSIFNSSGIFQTYETHNVNIKSVESDLWKKQKDRLAKFLEECKKTAATKDR